MSQKNKVYGLILPKKQGQVKAQSSTVSNVFQNDSDEDGDTSTGPVAPYKVATSSNKMKRQTQMDIDKALQEDPSIYEYDEVYDKMQASKPQVGFVAKDKGKPDRKPKYIAGLLKAAEVKKKEEERRVERKVQKEREAEGEMYADKEKFVTSAYKQKMLEMQEAEEKEKQESAFEAMTDVTKQKDMSGFYRYLYRQTGRSGDTMEPVAADKADVKEEPEEPAEQMDIKQEPASSPPSRSQAKQNHDRHRSSSASSSHSSGSHGTSPVKEKFSKSRHVVATSHLRRKRNDSSSSSASEPETALKTSAPKAKQARSRSSGSDGEDIKRKLSRDVSSSRNARRRQYSPEVSRGSYSPGTTRKVRSGKHHGSRSPQREPDRRRSRSPSDRKQKNRNRSRSPREDRRTRKLSRSPHEERDRRKRKSFSPQEESKSRPKSNLSSSRGEKEKLMNENNRGKHSKSSKVNGTEASVSENIKTLRDASGDSPTSGKSVTGAKSKPVDPAKKIYPHHNSAKDIEEARKRYLQRKLARERGHLG
ncbi:hypothetical protein RRG08_012383 [Elysia crispata]|uniref:Nuclear speckle splicing regulatory protein 1 N-terminal domain-containing protein n=1 Tax=Elysia crispata TaxID=231223 RepID=A0AAE0YIK6_9GAST|nr:hypothetical protein RRG08_012383 [Elysia crispata]